MKKTFPRPLPLRHTAARLAAGLAASLLALLLGVSAEGGSAKETVAEVAAPRRIAEGAPRASDVIMRALRLRIRHDRDPHDTMQALRDFHVTRLEWAYVTDRPFIEQVKTSGRLFGGAASAPSYFSDEKESDWLERRCVLNLDGERIIAPWKRTWAPTLWGCVNNPELERDYVAYLKQYLDAGAQVMQRDEPGANELATQWGGCFCSHCMQAFRQWLARHTTAPQRQQLGITAVATFDYRAHLKQQGAPVGDEFRRWEGGGLKPLFQEFQLQASVAFHERTRRAINEYAGRRVPFSCNNGVRRWTPIELGFDWAFGELSYRHARPGYLFEAMREAASHDRLQVVTMPKKGDYENPEAWELLTRQTVATAYALGGHCMVPWDVYMPHDAPRYFGVPEQYADLFAFIRANARYLDDYEYAGASGAEVTCNLYDAAPPVRVHADGDVYAFVRARPGQANAPVVVHLVDWSDDPQPFTLHLNPSRFYGDKALRLRLHVPAAYDQHQHAQAEQTRNYHELSKVIPIRGGHVASVDVPALTPWGILIIEPDALSPDGVWEPVIQADARDEYRKSLPVRMESASVAAATHYTIDGSEPTAASPRYTGPLRLTESTTLRARAFDIKGRASTIASASFAKTDTLPTPLAPDREPLKTNLRLWLHADALAETLKDGDPVTRWPAAAGPDAMAERVRLYTQAMATPPVLRTDALNRRPVVRFDGVNNLLAIAGFANEHLAGTAFTLLMVTRSADPAFGICGNGLGGTGGTPRLYLTRSAFNYDKLQENLQFESPADAATITTFTHDGNNTITALIDGTPAGTRSGLPVVEAFGGGNLALPFWAGNRNHAGDIAELIIFNRQLSDLERERVESLLAEKYDLPYRKQWRRQPAASSAEAVGGRSPVSSEK